MSYSFESDMFSSKRMSKYSVEDIDEAKKRQKKNSGTLMENLEAVVAEREGKKIDESQNKIDKFDDTISKLSDRMDIGGAPRELSTDEVKATISQLNANLAADFTSAQVAMEEKKTLDAPMALEQFAGLADVIKENVYGQDDFIKKLLIAFKRPFVTERDGNDCLNSIFITGPSTTGKHFTLNTLVEELSRRNVLKSGNTSTMNLSLYPTAAEEKLFLQDLYSAIQNESEVIVFEHFENCHISMLTRLTELVTTGECKLQDRYVMQKGQLVSVNNAFAGDTVGTFEAKGKYFVFVSEKSLEKVAGVMGAPFVNALGDVCSTADLSEEAIKQVSAKQEELLVTKGKKQLAYDIKLEDSFRDYVLTQSQKGRGLKGVLQFYADTIKALSQLRLERDDIASGEIILACEQDAPIIRVKEESIAMSSLLPAGYRGELDSIKEEMDAIVGLKEVKDYILSLEEYYAMQKRRREEGLKAGEVNKHMIFTGNPGTGKTTIARIVSKYLKAIGVLSGGQLVEVSRGDLVGRYAGHTAPLVNQVVKSALGGVLFIDEAYSLYRGEEDSFGLEAIDTLVKGIEDNRDNLIVILAGYSKEMEGFLEANSGLKSRFPNVINFPDYTGEELCDISKITAKSKGYTIDEAVIEPLKAFYEHIQATNAREAGNGRLVRNKIEEAILNQSRRLIAEEGADMSLLTEMDFDLTLE